MNIVTFFLFAALTGAVIATLAWTWDRPQRWLATLFAAVAVAAALAALAFGRTGEVLPVAILSLATGVGLGLVLGGFSFFFRTVRQRIAED